MGRALDLVGERFGNLVVVERMADRSITGAVVWKAICDCGSFATASTNGLRTGNNRSCGCRKLYRSEETRRKISEKAKKKWGSPEYRAQMKSKINAGRERYSERLRAEREASRRPCGCGCGGLASVGKNFLMGHATRGRKKIVMSDSAKKKMSLSQTRRFLDPQNHPRWNGGITYRSGYVFVRTTDHPRASRQGYVRRYWLTAEKALGRYLKKNEVVHHINGKRSDDRSDNLLICEKRYHDWLHNEIRRRANETIYSN